jgi:type IV secretory pathway VirB2 component (pilin)
LEVNSFNSIFQFVLKLNQILKIMKKIFLSLLFLLFISVATNAQAAICTGNPDTCVSRLTQDSCTGDATPQFSASGGSGFGCTWADNSGSSAASTNTSGTCSGTAVACNTISSAASCSLVGCQAISNADDNALVDVLCNALLIVQGNGGKAFAAFAIISVGIGFFTGKVSWGLMIGVTAGIAAMFGATSIVGAISGDDAVNCGASTRSVR